MYNKEARKFPKDDYDKNILYLISIDENNNEEYSFQIRNFQLDDIEDMTEIKIENDDDISKLDSTLEFISNSKKYNL